MIQHRRHRGKRRVRRGGSARAANSPFPTALVVILSIALLGIATGFVAQSILLVLVSIVVAGLMAGMVYSWVRL